MKHKPKNHPTKLMGRDAGTGRFIPTDAARADKKGAIVQRVKMVIPRKKRARKKGRR